MALLLRTPIDFEETAGEGPGTCPTCGEWLIRYVPYCSVCSSAKEGGPKIDAPEPLVGRKEKVEGAVRIAHLSDLHLGRKKKKPKPIEVLRIWLGEFAEALADVVVVSGDLVHKAGDRKSLAAVRGALESSELPYVVVPGNHDVGRPGVPGRFEQIYGAYPRIEEHAGIAFILVDSNAGLPPDERLRQERLFARVACFVEGRVGEAQLEQIDAALDGLGDHRRRVLVLHHHLVSQPDRYRRLGFMAPLQDAHMVRRWAVSRNVVLALHGHHHVMRRAGVQSGSLVVLNGGTSTLKGPPYRARMIDLQPDGRRRVIPVELRL